MGKVADSDCCWCATVLVEENNIAEAFALCGPHQFWEDEVSAIQPDPGRKE